MPGIFGGWGESLGHLVHLLVAFLLALPIGWNRARAEQSAGIRTFPLVAIASCGLVQTAVSALGAGAAAQGNVLQGLITGVGFIGAGAIIRQGEATTGTATAASIWTVGVIGAAVGYGYYDIGIVLAAANLAVLKFRGPAPSAEDTVTRARNRSE
ncbi:MAG TPA: MgtC/SapB family protein [Stellaceae bacterium]|jgi:putative Mg2+ transporter-C (MgtC) family protein|nr:MgtC/SapB family protein [Stellaceae bacterium]